MTLILMIVVVDNYDDDDVDNYDDDDYSKLNNMTNFFSPTSPGCCIGSTCTQR